LIERLIDDTGQSASTTTTGGETGEDDSFEASSASAIYNTYAEASRQGQHAQLVADLQVPPPFICAFLVLAFLFCAKVTGKTLNLSQVVVHALVYVNAPR